MALAKLSVHIMAGENDVKDSRLPGSLPESCLAAIVRYMEMGGDFHFHIRHPKFDCPVVFRVKLDEDQTEIIGEYREFIENHGAHDRRLVSQATLTGWGWASVMGRHSKSLNICYFLLKLNPNYIIERTHKPS